MIDAKEALKRLTDGNERFVSGKSTHPNRCDETKNSLLRGQKPFAVILSCSDSRVPVEIVFDVGLGDVFVIRTAGHVLSDEVMGSIEYAVQHLGVKLVMILGHENCGAIKSAVKSYKEKSFEKLSPYMQSIMKHILYQVEDLLKKDNFIAEKVQTGEITVVGAKYELKTGKIIIMSEKG